MFTSKSEEYTEHREEKRSTTGTRDSSKPSDEQFMSHETETPKQHPDHKYPKHQRHEKFTKNTQPSQPGHSPYCEDTYFSMKDESDDATDSHRTHKKTYVVSESHTKIMSDKKSEVHHYSSSAAPKPKHKDPDDVMKIEPSKMPENYKSVSTTRDEISSIIRQPVRVDTDIKHVEMRQQEVPVPVIRAQIIEPIPNVDIKFKSTDLVKNAQVQAAIEKELEPFPFEVKPTRQTEKLKGPPPPKPKIFVKGEFQESDYDSEFDGQKPRLKWVPPTDSESEDPNYARVKPSLPTRIKKPRDRTPTPPSQFDHPPTFEGHPRPKVEFPESDSEYERPPSPILIEVRATIAPKKLRTSTIKPMVIETPIKEYSPELKPEPIAEEGYIPPPPLPSHYSSNTVGVESTKITTISDTSQFHKRFITQQQTTRVFKLSDVKVTPQQPIISEPMIVPKEEVIFKSAPPLPPAPPPEELPFTHSPRRPKKLKSAPPSMPKKFQKGDFRESDYESEDDSRIRPKWQPSDSEADELSYNKVRAPKTPVRSTSRTRERSPTPPSVFDIPPECGAPLRPTVDKVIPLKYIETESAPDTKLYEFKNIKTPEVSKSTTHIMPIRELSPELPPPGPVPEEGIIVKTTEYVVDKVKVESHSAPPEVREVPTYQQRPYMEIVEKTEKIYRKKNLKEEVNFHKNRREKVTKVIHHYEDADISPTYDEVPLSGNEEENIPLNGDIGFTKEMPSENIQSSRFVQEAPLEEFPFKPSPPRPKKDRGAPPPMPKVFVMGDFIESDDDSDYDPKIKSKWNPPESETDDDPKYQRVPAPKLSKILQEEKRRTPTPPSRFEVPPEQGGPLRPQIKFMSKVDVDSAPSEPTKIAEIIKTPVKLPKTKVKISIQEEDHLPPPGPQPEFGFIKNKHEYVIEEKFHVQMNRSDDEYYPITDSDLDYTDSDIPKHPEIIHEYPRDGTKRVSGPIISERTKIFKPDQFEQHLGRKTDSSPVTRQRWGPPDSEGDEPSYRPVPRPQVTHRPIQQPQVKVQPQPPSEFDLPPQFEGPPRPIMEKYSLHHRERRESLEDYSVPKFPKVEFKPFINGDATLQRVTNGALPGKEPRVTQQQSAGQSQ